MASIPVTPPAREQPTEAVEEHFRRLEAVWVADTGLLSSYERIVSHPAFQEIIRMGHAVVPFMLRDLQERPRLWVWALPDITGADPVPVADRGNIGKMGEAWLRWAKANGYRW